MLKEIINMYFGEEIKFRDHLREDTAIAQFAEENTNRPLINKEENGEYLEPRIKYTGFLGINKEDYPDLVVFVSGTAEMLAKIKMIRQLKLNEKEIYSCPLVKEAIYELNEFFASISLEELQILGFRIGDKTLELLNERLDEGFIDSFDSYEDNQLSRAAWLYPLFCFYKYKEIKWFKFRSTLTNIQVQEDIEILSNRISSVFLDLLNKEQTIDFFPKYGYKDQLTVVADLQIGNSVYLISTRTKSDYSYEYLDREATILNACQWLSKNSRVPVVNKYIYHARWNAFTKTT